MRFIAALFAAASMIAPLRAEKIVLVAGGGAKEAGAPAAECRLREPFGVEFTPDGGMVIVEMTGGNRVLKVDAEGVLRVIAGTGAKSFSGDGAPATAATFNGIHNLAILPGGDNDEEKSRARVCEEVAVPRRSGHPAATSFH